MASTKSTHRIAKRAAKPGPKAKKEEGIETRKKKTSAKAAAPAGSVKRSRDGDDTGARKRVRASGPSTKEDARHVPTLNSILTRRLDVYVFGTATSGEFGIGPDPREGLKDPTKVKEPYLNHLLSGEGAIGGGIVQISVGGVHCAALTADGKVVTWGANDYSNLGRDTEMEEDESEDEEDDDKPELNPLESTPAVIPAANFLDGGDTLRFVQVLAIDNATFALAEDGQVWGCGTFRGNEGIFGFLRDKIKDGVKPIEDDKKELRPVRIPGISNVRSLAGGNNHVLALTHDGNVYAWGASGQNEVGHPFRETRSASPYDSLVPSRVPLPRGKIVAVYSAPHHSFAIDVRGRVFAWGVNNYGQTGIPPTPAERTGRDTIAVSTPQIVRSLAQYRISHIDGGLQHTIACTETGDVLVWGRCSEGQAGQPLASLPRGHLVFDSRDQPTDLSVPTVVPGVSAKYVAAGIDCCIALSADGQGFAWGYSEDFRTGLKTEDTVEAPRPLRGAALGRALNWAGCGGQFSLVAGPSTP